MKRILIVEDDRELQELLQEILIDEQYEVDLAANGMDALELLGRTTETYSLILLDLMMPVMDGYRCFQEMRCRGIHPAVPVIIMSANASTSHHILQEGANAFLRKPFEIDALLSLVATYDTKQLPLPVLER